MTHLRLTFGQIQLSRDTRENSRNRTRVFQDRVLGIIREYWREYLEFDSDNILELDIEANLLGWLSS